MSDVPTGSVVLIEHRPWTTDWSVNEVPTVHRIPAAEVRHVEVIAGQSGPIVQYQLATGSAREIRCANGEQARYTAALIVGGGDKSYCRSGLGRWEPVP